MTHLDPPGAASQRRWRVLAAALTLAAVVCLLMWAARSDPASPAGSTNAPEQTGTVAAEESAAADPAPPSAKPVRLSIPRIEVSTRVMRLGLEKDGTVEVPENAALAGWFRRGPPPGAPGSSVILGHVDSLTGPAVFYRLRELQPGDLMTVTLDDGKVVRFRVHSVETYANEDFPAQKVYGKQGRSQLNLVTCGGDYDASQGGYQSNVVVNARLV